MIENTNGKEDTYKGNRPHSKTVSGPPLLNIETSTSQGRRNSDGSANLIAAPPISVSEPTPIETTYQEKEDFFTSKPLPDDNSDDNHSILSNQSGQQQNLLDSSHKKKSKSRSRASSITSNIINEIKESSTIQKVTSKIKPRPSADEAENVPETINLAPSIAASVSGASGHYLASSKKNQDFHSLFRSVPEDDGLIEDYGCALQKEILLQGRIYISESYVCFNANIFGWVTNLVIAFADIIEIEKKSTAYFIPNAIQISTDSSKHFFASFLSRDQAYDLIVDIWRIARPDLAPPKERAITEVSEDAKSLKSEEEDDDSEYDSDTEDSYSDETDSDHSIDNPSSNTVTQATEDIKAKPRKVSAASETINNKNTKIVDANRRRAASEAIRPSMSIEQEKSSKLPIGDLKSISEKPTESTIKEEDTQLHEKTECECSSNTNHYPTVVMDQCYNGTVEKFYDLLFKNEFMTKFLTENQKTTELTMGEWKKGEGKVKAVREFSYIKPLNGAIGPRSTKCYITDEVLHDDTTKFLTVLTTTSTPDVPSGGSFSCKTKTCITWAGKKKVRILVTVLVDFTKSSWLKSTIEKASIDGQQNYYKDLDAALQVYFKQHPGDFGKSSEGRKKRRERRPRSKRTRTDDAKVEENSKSSTESRISEIISSVLEVISSPRATHLTLFCLIIMVCVNLFIAKKMAFVEQQLVELNRVVPQHQQEDGSYIPSQRQSIRQEEDDLWDWLGRVDPDKSSEVTEKIRVPAGESLRGQEEVWDDAIRITKLAKDRIDKHMIELSNMIQKAESSLGDVTRSVKIQREKIKKEVQ